MPRTGGLEPGAPSLRGEAGLRSPPCGGSGSQGEGKGLLVCRPGLGWVSCCTKQSLILFSGLSVPPTSPQPAAASLASCHPVPPAQSRGSVMGTVTCWVTCGCFASIPASLSFVPGAVGRLGCPRLCEGRFPFLFPPGRCVGICAHVVHVAHLCLWICRCVCGL